jgi:hypothetical protein
MRIRGIVAAAAMAMMAAAPAAAQDSSGRAGWTFTPSFSFVETYDDNITLFGTGPVDAENNDLITSYAPGANLTYNGRRTRFGGGYSGSFLAYRNNSVFNRWDQRAQVNLQRTESARLDWSMSGSLTKRPSTEALDFDGIPFSHTGATAQIGRGGFGYKIGARDSIAAAVMLQKVSFDRPGELLPYLRGGRSLEMPTTYRRRLNGRTAVGANYAFRRAWVTGERVPLVFHVVRAAVDHQLSPLWSVSAGAGFDYLRATTESDAQRTPAWAVMIDRTANRRRFSAGYQRLLLPSFGFGGAIVSQELIAAYHTPLFNSRYFYTDHSVSFRDSHPVVAAPDHLPLRSLRTNSVFGWAPRPWVQLEAFYARALQSTLIPGGRINRNRLGVQIVTSAPMRVQ